jgi:hypothetical protein
MGVDLMSEKRKLFALVAAVLVCIAACSCILYRCYRYSGEPLLKIAVRKEGALIWSGGQEYYSVYPNGGRRKLSEFTPRKVAAYRVDERAGDSIGILIDSNTGNRLGVDDNAEIYGIANDILELIRAERGDGADVYKLYALGGRYFFDVFDSSRAFTGGFSDTIYEYVPDRKIIIKVAIFHTKNIEHMELY